MAIDNYNLIQLQACKKASDDLSDILKKNDLISNTNNVKTQNYNAAHKIWENNKKTFLEGKYNDWKNKSGIYSKWIKNDGESHGFWSADNGTCWWGENRSGGNEWCRNKANEKGLDGENYSVGSWGWCDGRYGNFSCQKNDDIKQRQKNDYLNDEPKFNEAEPNIKNFGIQDFLPLENINIQCCSNFQNLVGTDIEGNIQTCNQSIEKKIQSLIADPQPNPTSFNNDLAKFNNPVYIEGLSDNDNKWTILIIIIVVVMLLFSMSSVFGVILT